MLTLIKKFIPPFALAAYHKSLAVLANLYYLRPSEKLIVIGVTGTNGKTTVVSLIAKILDEAGFKTGVASTAIFKVGEKEWLNDKKMTMLGRFALQKLLSAMVRAGCKYAVIETSSQGIEQFRHLGLHYDVCVFTNLTPEHLEAHGGFENYKRAKLKLFKHLEKLPEKVLNSPPFQGGVRGGSESNSKPLLNLPLERGERIQKVIIANGDDKYASEFLDFKVDEKIVYGIEHRTWNMEHDFNNNLTIGQFNNLIAQNIEYGKTGVSFDINNINFNLQLFGKFNVYNSLAAIAIAQSQGIDLKTAKKALEKVTSVPGRMEFIETKKDFKVIVDYAPEPESMRQLFETIKIHKLAEGGLDSLKPNGGGGKIIHVFGSCGGGRDSARRPVLGKISAENSGIVIITNEDPYDDNPTLIIDQVAQGAISGGLVLGQNLFKIGDRRQAVAKALTLAQAGDLVLLTGKGSEQAICVANGKKIPWDEREVVREELGKL